MITLFVAPQDARPLSEIAGITGVQHAYIDRGAAAVVVDFDADIYGTVTDEAEQSTDVSLTGPMLNAKRTSSGFGFVATVTPCDRPGAPQMHLQPVGFTDPAFWTIPGYYRVQTATDLDELFKQFERDRNA